MLSISWLIQITYLSCISYFFKMKLECSLCFIYFYTPHKILQNIPFTCSTQPFIASIEHWHPFVLIARFPSIYIIIQ
jgi:hypothetical protein